jgi:predicted HTH transcriptional regulator
LYKYYKDGTHEAYHLFNSRAKITTYRSLKWHFYVLHYLNQDNNIDINSVFEFIANKENGFVTFFISDKKLQDMIKDVFALSGDPPVNKKRKILFKDYSGLTPEQKMSIVGKLIGRSSSVNAETIYQCMLDLNELNKKITWGEVASLLNCSERTIQRNINNTLKKEKQLLNEDL